MILADGRWYSQYPPGHALSLLLGVWVGAPWIVNPILGGLAIYAISRLAAELFDPRTARWSGLLALLSPFLMFMSSEFMSHATSLAGITLGYWLFFRSLRTGSLRTAGACGAAMAWALLARPYSTVAMLVPLGLYVAGGWLGGRGGDPTRGRALDGSPRLRSLAVYAAVIGIGVALLLLYNLGTTGSPTRFGYEELYGASHGVGLGKGSWGPPLTLERGVVQVVRNFSVLHRQLFAWPIGSLWPLLLGLGLSLAFVVRGWKGRDIDIRAARSETMRELWLLSTILSLGAFHAFYWYQDLCFGPRYLYEAMGPIVILSARGLVRLEALGAPLRPARASSAGVAQARNGRIAKWCVALVIAALFSWAFVAEWPKFFPPHPLPAGNTLASRGRFASYFEHYSPTYWGVDPHLGREVERLGLSKALVFVRTAEVDPPSVKMRYLFFGSAFAHQRPDWSGADVLFARDLGERDRELIALFPSRTPYLFEGSIENGTIRRYTDE
jgi:4-amino-4-deoxy-L-arabinose transferase-like glycosyltransferase